MTTLEKYKLLEDAVKTESYIYRICKVLEESYFKGMPSITNKDCDALNIFKCIPMTDPRIVSSVVFVTQDGSLNLPIRPLCDVYNLLLVTISPNRESVTATFFNKNGYATIGEKDLHSIMKDALVYNKSLLDANAINPGNATTDAPTKKEAGPANPPKDEAPTELKTSPWIYVTGIDTFPKTTNAKRYICVVKRFVQSTQVATQTPAFLAILKGNKLGWMGLKVVSVETSSGIQTLEDRVIAYMDAPEIPKEIEDVYAVGK